MRLASRGFSLLEVVIALGILALGLGVLLQAQAQSLAAASRTRGLTLATLLTRSKMVDIERRLFDEGFTLGDSEDAGDFGDEGQPEFSWSYRITELELDFAALQQGEEEDAANDDGIQTGAALGLPLDALTTKMSEDLRAVELVVTWPSGKHEEKMKVRALVTRELTGAGVEERAP